MMPHVHAWSAESFQSLKRKSITCAVPLWAE
jgi:hypothetical protein